MKINKQKGFTLIELLVVMFVISVISTIMVVNWRKNEKQYVLQRTAQEIVQNIRRAQTMALEGKQNMGVIPNETYGVHFEPSTPNYYFIYADGNGNETWQPSDDFMVGEIIPITEGVEIYSLSSNPQDMDINFSIPDGFISISPHGSSATITIRRTGMACPTNCKDIIINQSGEITIQ